VATMSNEHAINFLDTEFPEILMELLNQNKTTPVCGWNEDGKSFYIRDSRRFFRKILEMRLGSLPPKSFRNFLDLSTFLTVAGEWGFIYRRGVNEDILQHPLFQRDLPELIYHMKKQRNAVTIKEQEKRGTSSKKRNKRQIPPPVKLDEERSRKKRKTANPNLPGVAVPPVSVSNSLLAENSFGRLPNRASIPGSATFDDMVESEVSARLSKVKDHFENIAHHNAVQRSRQVPPPSLMMDDLNFQHRAKLAHLDSMPSAIGPSLLGPRRDFPLPPAMMRSELPSLQNRVYSRHLEDYIMQTEHEMRPPHVAGLSRRATLDCSAPISGMYHQQGSSWMKGNVSVTPDADHFIRKMPPAPRLSLPTPQPSERALPFASRNTEAQDYFNRQKKMQDILEEVNCKSAQIMVSIQTKEKLLDEMRRDSRCFDIETMKSLMKGIQRDKDLMKDLDKELLAKKVDYLEDEISGSIAEEESHRQVLTHAAEVQRGKKEISAVMVERARALARIPGPSRHLEKLQLERSMNEQAEEMAVIEQELREMRERSAVLSTITASKKVELTKTKKALTQMRSATSKLRLVEEYELTQRIEAEEEEIKKKKRIHESKEARLRRENEELRLRRENEELLSRRKKIEDLQREQELLEKTLQEKKDSDKQKSTLENQHALEEIVAAKMAVMMVRATRK